MLPSAVSDPAMTRSPLGSRAAAVALTETMNACPSPGLKVGSGEPSGVSRATATSSKEWPGKLLELPKPATRTLPSEVTARALPPMLSCGSVNKVELPVAETPHRGHVRDHYSDAVARVLRHYMQTALRVLIEAHHEGEADAAGVLVLAGDPNLGIRAIRPARRHRGREAFRVEPF